MQHPLEPSPFPRIINPFPFPRVHKRPPFHRVVVYHQSQKTDKGYVSPTPLISLATHVIIAAFHLNVNDDENKRAHLNDDPLDDPSLTQLWIDVARMQGSGIKVLGMLGGAGGRSFQNLTQDFDKYYKSLKSCIRSRRLDGIDLDVEWGGEALADIVKLIKQLRTDFGQDFIITLAPVASALSGGDNISCFDYSDLEATCGDDIDWYNAQFYSGFGSMENTTDYTNIIQKFPLDPSRLVAITLTNPRNASGWVGLDKVKSTMRQLLKTYGDQFGGVAGWEYFNSHPDGENEPWTWAAVMKTVMANWKEVIAAKQLA